MPNCERILDVYKCNNSGQNLSLLCIRGHYKCMHLNVLYFFLGALLFDHLGGSEIVLLNIPFFFLCIFISLLLLMHYCFLLLLMYFYFFSFIDVFLFICFYRCIFIYLFSSKRLYNKNYRGLLSILYFYTAR